VRDGELPVTLTRANILDLRRPFPADVIRWKIQSVKETSAQIIAYIDARIAIERLNFVTPHWSDAYERVSETAMVCRLSVMDVVREDVGTISKDAFMAEDVKLKALYSDALKRAAVKFGVGVSIYELPTIWMKFGEAAYQLPLNRQNKPYLHSRNQRNLRERYAKWLEEVGVPAFGAVIEHEAYLLPEAQGDPDTDIVSEGPSGPAEGTEPALLGPRVQDAWSDAVDAFTDAVARYGSRSHDELAAGQFMQPPTKAEFQRLLREATARSSGEDIGPLVELTARLEKLG
jgi:hypothetical protein